MLDSRFASYLTPLERLNGGEALDPTEWNLDHLFRGSDALGLKMEPGLVKSVRGRLQEIIDTNHLCFELGQADDEGTIRLQRTNELQNVFLIARTLQPNIGEINVSPASAVPLRNNKSQHDMEQFADVG